MYVGALPLQWHHERWSVKSRKLYGKTFSVLWPGNHGTFLSKQRAYIRTKALLKHDFKGIIITVGTNLQPDCLLGNN